MPKPIISQKASRLVKKKKMKIEKGRGDETEGIQKSDRESD